MVVVDKLIETTHFVPVNSTYKAVEIVDIFMKEIFQFHNMPKVVISSRDVEFKFALWKAIFTRLGNQIQFSVTYHPHTAGQIEWVNQEL